MSDGIIKYCMGSSFLGSAYVKFGDVVFNLLTINNGDPVSLEKAIHMVFSPDICATFSIASVKALNLIFVLSNISIEAKAACNLVCSTITEAS